MSFSSLCCTRVTWSHATPCHELKHARSTGRSLQQQCTRSFYPYDTRIVSTRGISVVSKSLPEQNKQVCDFFMDNSATNSSYHSIEIHRIQACVMTQDDDDDTEITALDEEEFRELFDTTNQIPGTYQDAMSKKTKLGAAIRDACNELDTLGSLEQSMLQEAEDLLKKVGYKGSLFEQQPEED
jgi:hypothetical protein